MSQRRGPASERVIVGEILEYQNDDSRKEGLIRLESGEIISVRFVMGEDAPRFRIAKLAPLGSAEVEVLWEVDWSAENWKTLVAQFGEPPAVSPPGLPMLEAAVRSLKECRSITHLKHQLEKTLRFKG